MFFKHKQEMAPDKSIHHQTFVLSVEQINLMPH